MTVNVAEETKLETDRQDSNKEIDNAYNNETEDEIHSLT